MKLRLGIMKNAELAEWFGIKEDSFKRTKKEKLETLARYCTFTQVKGKINITHITLDEYIKDPNSASRMEAAFHDFWAPGTVNTGTNVGTLMLADESLSLTIAPNTAAQYVRGIRKLFYGDTTGCSYGTKGVSRRLWAIEEGIDYRKPTQEELEKIKKIVNEHLGKNSTELIEAYDKGIETKFNNKYSRMYKELERVLKARVVRGTLIKEATEGFFGEIIMDDECIALENKG